MIVTFLCGVWLALFGVWPAADPGHSLSDPLAVFDIIVHVVGGYVAFLAWREMHLR